MCVQEYETWGPDWQLSSGRMLMAWRAGLRAPRLTLGDALVQLPPPPGSPYPPRFTPSPQRLSRPSARPFPVPKGAPRLLRALSAPEIVPAGGTALHPGETREEAGGQAKRLHFLPRLGLPPSPCCPTPAAWAAPRGPHPDAAPLP